METALVASDDVSIGHSVHTLFAAASNVCFPTEHEMQWSSEFCELKPPVVFPATQSRHTLDVAATFGEYFPDTQAVQESGPAVVLYFPAIHSWQVSPLFPT